MARFLDLPNEILLTMAEIIATQWWDSKQWYKIAKVNKRLYHLLIPFVYREESKYSPNRAGLWAFKRGQAVTLQKAIENGAQLDSLETRAGCFAIAHRAVSYQISNFVNAFSANDTNINAQSSYGKQALHIVMAQHPAHSGPQGLNAEPCTFLIETGAEFKVMHIHQRDEDVHGTSLHPAALQHDTSVVKLLLEHGADANATDDNGQTPLHWALRSFDRGMWQTGETPFYPWKNHITPAEGNPYADGEFETVMFASQEIMT